MKINKFLTLFTIEEAIVNKISYIDNTLKIEVATNARNYAMGNNIREDDLFECITTYTFNHVYTINLDISKITNIFYTTCVNNEIVLKTNIGNLIFESDEVTIS